LGHVPGPGWPRFSFYVVPLGPVRPISPRTLLGAAAVSRTTQRLFFEIGFDSSIATTSPTLYLLASSWAWYFFDRRMVFFSTGWVKRRSTRTTTVLSFLSLTTTPCRTRFGIVL